MKTKDKSIDKALDNLETRRDTLSICNTLKTIINKRMSWGQSHAK